MGGDIDKLRAREEVRMWCHTLALPYVLLLVQAIVGCTAFDTLDREVGLYLR
jgi:hypothetical protein